MASRQLYTGCRLLGKRGGIGLALGSFSHYGATGPPYWAYAYPLAPWLQDSSAEQARYQLSATSVLATQQVGLLRVGWGARGWIAPLIQTILVRVAQVMHDVPFFTKRMGQGEPPRLVIVGSGFWDISAWWLHEGRASF